MAINIANCPVKSTGSNTDRTFDERFGADIIDVKDYGAVGNGIHDDTAGIQAAINAAGFNNVALSKPHKMLWFSPGAYVCLGPVYMKNVTGGVVINMGWQAIWQGSPGNNVTGDGLTPCLVCENVNNTTFKNCGWIGSVTLQGGGNTNSVGMYFFCTGGGTCDNNMITNGDINDLAYGVILGGTGSDQLVRNFLAISFKFVVNVNGLLARSAASTGHQLFGGGSNNCGIGALAANDGDWNHRTSTYLPGSLGALPGGAYLATNGQIAVLSALSQDANCFDCCNTSNYPMSILGCRAEKRFVCEPSHLVVGGAGPMYCTGGVAVGEGPFTGTNKPTGNQVMYDLFNGGRLHLVGSTYGFVGAHGSGKTMAQLSSTGCLTLDGWFINNNSGGASFILDDDISGSTGSNIAYGVFDAAPNQTQDIGGTFSRTNWFPSNGFGGCISIDIGPTTYNSSSGEGGIPIPSAAYKGARCTMIDCTLTASGNFRAIITASQAGGTNVVPLYCDGTNWRIG